MNPSVQSKEVYQRIRHILESTRAAVARSVNTAQVVANWLVGREIVEEQQRGKRRAEYGEELLKELSHRLTEGVGRGWSVRNLEYCRTFYLEYPVLLDREKSNALRSISVRVSPEENHLVLTGAEESSLSYVCTCLYHRSIIYMLLAGRACMAQQASKVLTVNCWGVGQEPP
jgi:hypothetical protein